MDTFQYKTLLDGFDDSVARNPKHPCITFMGRTTDYAHVQLYARRFAVYLRGLGIQPGERVMIHLPNCPQWTIAYLGCFYAGVIAVPYSPTSPKLELSQKIKEYGAAAIVTLNIFYSVVMGACEEDILKEGNPLRCGPIVASIPEFMPIPVSVFFSIGYTWKIQHAIKDAKNKKASCPVGDLKCLEEAETMEAIPRAKMQQFKESRKMMKRDAGKFTFFGAIIHENVSQDELDALGKYRPSPSDMAEILSTGGTTGGQKGVVFTHEGVADNANRCLNLFDTKRGVETFFVALPLDHAFALTVAHNSALLSGGKMVAVVDASDIPTLKKSIEKEKPTIFVGVPALYAVLAERYAGENWGSIKYAISGGSALPLVIGENFNRVVGKNVIRQGGGSTELGPVIACNPPTGLNVPESIGIPPDGIDIKIMTVKGGHIEEALPGEVGEIWVKSPSVMAGYWQNPEATAEVFTKDGQFKMADLGFKDENGYVHFKERTDDVIVDIKGRKKYPNDIEKVLYTHPFVADVSVVGVDNEVVAFVVLRKEYATNDETAKLIKEHVAAHMPRYNVPKVVRFEKELPKSRLKKNLRRVLRDKELAVRASSKE